MPINKDILQAVYVVTAGDNVATALTDVAPGPVVLRGAISGISEAKEAIAFGHKLALADIAAGQPVIKFGYTIGTAARAVAAGSLVHMHNLHSPLDQRSNEFQQQKEAEMENEYTLFRGEERIC